MSGHLPYIPRPAESFLHGALVLQIKNKEWGGGTRKIIQPVKNEVDLCLMSL